MIDHILAVFILACVFFSTGKAVSWIIDVVMAKFVSGNKQLSSAVSKLISVASLHFGGIEKDKDYSVKTSSYTITIQKNKK
ncbi:hypothetical protein [Klebsiella pneumoniae]|uniref:hypothetical protein n=2 Tax=Klebsiella pneumoniae TaxID=573 RepID=UPI0007CC244F|nr:hypothetical protein [Klebsiella pneumoniae]SAT75990.1 Uncharacterised protein [Klebsiella pneumoniae]